MTWRGTLRSMQAAARRAEREAQRRQRELQKEQAQLERMQELERASYEVAAYENRVELLLSAHKECGERWDWEGLAAQSPPIEPSLSHDNEERARAGLENYNPGLLDKAFRRLRLNSASWLRKLRERSGATKPNITRPRSNAIPRVFRTLVMLDPIGRTRLGFAR